MARQHKPKDIEQQQREPEEPRNDGETAASVGEKIEEEAGELVREAEQDVEAARRPWYQSIRTGHILAATYIIVSVLFALLAWWVYYHPVASIDVTITREFQENQNPWLKYTMLAISYPGSQFWLSTGLIVLAVVLFWIVDLRLEALIVAALSLVSALLNDLIKVLVDRPRPTAHLVEIIQGAGGPSFPSGHVMSYVVFWGLLFSFSMILFQGNRWWRLLLLILPTLLVVLVGPSRIYLGDHWASDVLGGYLFGGLLLGITLWIYLRLKERGVLAPRKNWSWYTRGRKKSHAGTSS